MFRVLKCELVHAKKGTPPARRRPGCSRYLPVLNRDVHAFESGEVAVFVDRRQTAVEVLRHVRWFEPDSALDTALGKVVPHLDDERCVAIGLIV